MATMKEMKDTLGAETVKELERIHNHMASLSGWRGTLETRITQAYKWYIFNRDVRPGLIRAYRIKQGLKV